MKRFRIISIIGAAVVFLSAVSVSAQTPDMDSLINAKGRFDRWRVYQLKESGIIGGNINQIAKKANEINSIHAGDIEKLQEEYNSVCHTLNQFLSTLQSTAA